MELYNSDSFSFKLDVLNLSIKYSILFRVCYGDDSAYKMLGDQVNLEFNDFLNVQTILLARLRTSMYNYKYTSEDISDIQLLIYKLK